MIFYPHAYLSHIKWHFIFVGVLSSPRVQSHLLKVYSSLALTLLTSAIGVAADIKFQLGGVLSSIGMAMIMASLALQKDQMSNQQRVGLMGVYGFLQGCSLGQLVGLAVEVNPNIPLVAFVATSAIFACFSLCAIYSPRRSYLYLGGILSSSILFMVGLTLVSIFYRPMWIYSIQLYFGLAIFVAYVIYDTQLIIEVSSSSKWD